MNALTSRYLITGALGLLTLISGVLVTRAGRPLNSGLFGIHKLVSVAMMILFFVVAKRLLGAWEGQAAVQVGMTVLTGVLFLSMVVSGAFLSFERELPAFVLRVHQVVPLPSLIAAAATIYLSLPGRG